MLHPAAKTIVHEQTDTKIVEVFADSVIVTSPQDALDLLMNVSYEHNATKIILRQRNITPDFFVLKTHIAGEVLQKVVNYRCYSYCRRSTKPTPL